MANLRRGTIEWFSPDPRGVIPLETFHVPGSLGRVWRRSMFTIRASTCFETVMRACAAPRPDGGSWIDERLIAAYVALHETGHAQSVEAWRGERLVGGLYGVNIAGAFFGESMFVRPDDGGTNASKLCLIALVHHLRERGFTLLDTQFWNPHLDQFGCVEITRDAYHERLADALGRSVEWEPWTDVPPAERATGGGPAPSGS
ncbi:MAG: leucyl/phenylalanyl-tRNA--protein transferase [Phycisphaerales bacterium]|nr:leucyl/phenylalanyl-tRNA--protein transferase [Phycisphaerae bacterium]NNF41666.1 leucyl/phenylalanyl-tRNA--protein transferase [Phycisphaerales bacterium]NNM27612.1 leucyl/phenylalanyl-tRNA--protein transferase [Phycisphaerales bacterium]